MMGTDTRMPTPTCENCGREKSATYICDACVDVLNAVNKNTEAERDRLAAENAELRNELAAANAAYATLLESHERLLDALTESDETLDKLREVVPKYASAWCEECCACVALDEYQDCATCGAPPDKDSHASWLMNKLYAILYPPKETPDDNG